MRIRGDDSKVRRSSCDSPQLTQIEPVGFKLEELFARPVFKIRDELDVRWTVLVRMVRLDFKIVIIGDFGFLPFDLEGDGWNHPSLPFVGALFWFRK